MDVGAAETVDSKEISRPLNEDKPHIAANSSPSSIITLSSSPAVSDTSTKSPAPVVTTSERKEIIVGIKNVDSSDAVKPPNIAQPPVIVKEISAKTTTFSTTDTATAQPTSVSKLHDACVPTVAVGFFFVALSSLL